MSARPSRLASLWVLLGLAPLLYGCEPGPDQRIAFSGPTMGTGYTVQIARPPAGLDAGLIQAGIEAVLAEVTAELSTYDPHSELSRLNADQSTDWLPVSRHLAAVLREGLALAELSDGAFDITVGPLVNLWGFGPDGPREQAPTPAAIAGARARVGYRLVELREDPPALRKARGDVSIDLSALGEGVGADRMAAYLEARGVTDYLVAVAGTMRVRGRNARGMPWGIAVEQPTPDARPGARVVQRVLPITVGAVSTSGDYRNFFAAGGRRYSHHIDPRTGESVAHRLASVTVVLPEDRPDAAMRADGLATALIVQGEARAPAVAAAEDLAVLFILRDEDGFQEILSPALARLLAQ